MVRLDLRRTGGSYQTSFANGNRIRQESGDETEQLTPVETLKEDIAVERRYLPCVNAFGLDQTGPKSKSVTPASGLLTLISQAHLLEGEEQPAYDELLARIRAAVTPVDIIDEMLIIDMASLEVLRWRRLKSNLMQARGLKTLADFLAGKLEYHLYSDQFADDLTKILQDNFPGDKAGAAQILAHACARRSGGG